VDALGGVHRIADCQSSQLDTVGKELAVSPVNFRWGNTKEGGKEAQSNFPLQRLEEGACVSDHALDVLPFILKAKRESCAGCLGIAFGDDT
jgi:hypothetical protein